jgi:hypothetical protein
MSTLNVNIPHFYCFLRKEFLYDSQAHQGEFIKVCVFGASSIQGRALGFHVLIENGATFWRLPIHALCHRQDAPQMELACLQVWDCASYEMSAITFDRIFEARVKVHLADNKWYPGAYMFTLDWHGSVEAQDSGDGGHKCAHIISLDNGNYAAMPNNCIQWFDPCFVTPFKEKPDFKTNTHLWKVEKEGMTTDEYYYDFQFSTLNKHGTHNNEKKEAR